MSTRHAKTKTLFITGTDTGVGKTVLTCLLVYHLRESGRNVAAFKPLCSGGRDDARAIRSAIGDAASLDTVNPWHLQAALAPSLAASMEKKFVTLAQVTKYLQRQAGAGITLVEGAGGLLSPMGKDFDSRDLLLALDAIPLIVVPNRLGAVNQARLAWEALPKAKRACARIVLMQPPRPNLAASTNLALLREHIPTAQLNTLPWLNPKRNLAEHARQRDVQRVLSGLIQYV